MPQAKRRVTFSRPPVGVGVSRAWGVETWTVSQPTETAETRLKSWTSQEIHESTNLMGVTMTMCLEDMQFWIVVLRWIVLERWQLLVQLRPSPRLEKHVALQLCTRHSFSSLEVSVSDCFTASSTSIAISSGAAASQSLSAVSSCLRHRPVVTSVRTDSQKSPPRDADSFPSDPVPVSPQKPSVASWFQRCLRVSHLFEVPSSRKMDSTDRTHIPGISRAPANGTSVVGKIATAAKMMCLNVLMVRVTSCSDRLTHAIRHG